MALIWVENMDQVVSAALLADDIEFPLPESALHRPGRLDDRSSAGRQPSRSTGSGRVRVVGQSAQFQRRNEPALPNPLAKVDLVERMTRSVRELDDACRGVDPA